MRPQLEKHCHKMIDELSAYGVSYYISYRGKNHQAVLVNAHELVVARGWNAINNKLMTEYFKLVDEVYST